MMEQQRDLQQCTILSTKKHVQNSKANSTEDNIDVTSKKEIEESFFLTSFQFHVFNEPNELTTILLNINDLDNHNYERINFIRIYREKLNNNELPVNFDQWTVEQQHNHLMDNVDKYFPNIPISLRFILPAIFKEGDCGYSMNEKPDWLDMDKFRRGQAFVQRYFAAICLAQLMFLPYIFTFADGLKTLIMSQKSNTPYRAFHRYLSTILRVSHWYKENPWDERTQAYQDMQAVRKMHLTMRRKLCSYSYKQIDAMSQIPNASCRMLKTLVEDFRDSCPAASNFQCPFTMTRTKSLNQGDMSCTQFAFMGLIVLYPEKFGLHRISDEDMDAFCHIWRAFGYLLGIEDRYNFCRGSLQDVRTRCSNFVEYWIKPNLRTVTTEWEHMTKCFYEGVKFYVCVGSYKMYLLYSYHILNMEMPRLRNSLNFLEITLYKLYQFILDYLVMMPFVIVIMNVAVRTGLNWAKNFGPAKHAKLKKRSREIIGFQELPSVILGSNS